MKLRVPIIILVMLLSAVGTNAQTDGEMRQIYTQAESAYKLGQIDQTIALLEKNYSAFQGNVLQNALRLLALCYLAQDNKAMSEQYAQMLLDANPYYTSAQDPIRFEDMITLLKSGRTSTITTASSQAEDISEAPVPVTIITKEMIDRLSNNKSLGQILATYVPGLSEVSSYSISNIAMHGVYTSGQEKILIMENGHRMNARSTNNGKVDYAISTEKIDHIEVLRGPASSLYGNVALTAVVNIITKNGREVDGLKGKYGFGTHGTHRADLIAGTTFMGNDILVWGSVYTSKGEKVSLQQGMDFANPQRDGYAYVGRYEGKPSYDIGGNLNIKDFSVKFSHKYGKQVPQYSWFGEVYDYDNYRKFLGHSIGYSIDEAHLELGYSKALGNVQLNVLAYGDEYKFYDYAVVSDSITNVILTDDYTALRDDDGNIIQKTYSHLYQDINWREYTVGAVAKADAPYTIGTMKGKLLVGVQYEFFTLDNNETLIGEDYERFTTVVKESKNLINNGHETSFSAFVQGKHYFLDNLILSAGLRYDNKYRKNHVSVEAYSPRVALIYLPSKSLSTKISYSRAFVDAPYFYRQNTSNPYRGSQNLMPEYMSAVQIDLLGKISKWNLSYDVNIFYNRLTDIIVNTPSTDINAPKYINAGSLRIAGVEGQADYRRPSFSANASITYQYPIKATQYYYADHKVYSVPSFMASINGQIRLYTNSQHSLWLTGNLKSTSKTLNKPNIKATDGDTFELSGYTLLDLGMKYRYGHTLQVSLDCDNVFDKTYYIGGTSYFPYQYPRRMVMGTLSFDF